MGLLGDDEMLEVLRYCSSYCIKNVLASLSAKTHDIEVIFAGVRASTIIIDQTAFNCISLCVSSERKGKDMLTL